MSNDFNPAHDPSRITHHSAVGVLLMSFGTAETLDEVPAYLARVRAGRPAPDELVAEFRRRLQLVGGSPLTRITREQAAALEEVLNAGAGDGAVYRVQIGMRHAPPFIADGLQELTGAGARHMVAVILSPQSSPEVMGGYLRAVEAAQATLGDQIHVGVAGPWHEVPELIHALATRVREALARFGPEEEAHVPVLFTAHSLPRDLAEQEPGYIQQLRETARAVAEQAGLLGSRWSFAYQSAGHTGDEWLGPDVREVLPTLRAAGHRKVLIAPVQFVADHLEVLYDIDVAARQEAQEVGIELYRTESLNTMPAFIRALASVVRREIHPPREV